MSQPGKHKIGAAFLLIIFSLNTVAGFACSIGLNMGYNSGHHRHSKTHTSEVVHVHLYTCKGIAKLKAEKEDCCSGEINRFLRMDKSVAYSNLLLKPLVVIKEMLTALVPSLKNEPRLNVKSEFQFVRRSCFLNDSTIQTAIRRFQI